MKTKAKSIGHEDKSLRTVNNRLKRENAQLRKKNDMLKTKSKKLKKKIKELDKENRRIKREKAAIKKENKRLKKELAKITKKLSKLKDEKEPQKDKKPVFWKAKNKKKQNRPGAPKGHKGVSRPRPKPEEITHWETMRPGDCPDCGTDLRRIKKTKKGDTRYYWNIPPPKPIVREVTEERVWCPKCKKYISPKSDEVLPYKRFGINLTVFATFLNMIGIPWPKIQCLLSTMYCINISEAALREMEKTVADALGDDYEKIKKEIKEAKAVGGDETSWPIDGKLYWLWAFVTETVTFYMIHKSRGKAVPTSLLNDGNDGCLVDDGLSAYNQVERPKQQCLVHVNRQLQRIEVRRGIEARGFMKEEPPVFTRPGRPPEEFLKFAHQLRTLMREAVEFSKVRASKKAREEAAKKFEARLEELANRDYKDEDCKRKAKFLRQHKDEIFTFVRRPEVPWHNNATEREIRGPVVTRKVSYGHKSETGAEAYAKVMSVYRTCTKKGIDFLEYVRRALRKGLPIQNASDN